MPSSDRSRIIVVREPDGTLRTSNWEEQDRLNQTYFPREGRRHYVPAMFQTENLKPILGPSKYEYILDRCEIKLVYLLDSISSNIVEIVSSLSQITLSISKHARRYMNILTSTDILMLFIPQGILINKNLVFFSNFVQALWANGIQFLLEQTVG